MKVTKFMTGDWVLINEVPKKVQAVDGVDDEIMADGEAYCLAEDRYHSEDKVTGVPITPEILEKNGFTNGEFYAESHIEDWQIMSDSNHLAARSERGWCIDIPCQYVHELQQVFRLCRIEKEIKI